MGLVKAFFQKVFDVEPHELGQTHLFLIYLISVSVFAMSSLTVGEALFLSHYTSLELQILLPWIYISIAIGSILITTFYNNFLESISRIKLVMLIDLIFTASIILFRYLITVDSLQGWIYFVLYIWLDACAAFKILLFYSFAGDFFTSYEAKRLYGYITNGLPLGALIGGFILTFLFEYVPVRDSLYFCASICILSSIAAYSIKQNVAEKNFELEESDSFEPVTLKTVFSNRYLNLIFLIVAFSAMCWGMSDYILLRTAHDTYKDAQPLAEFFTKFFSIMGLIQLTIQLFFATRMIKRFGVINNLFILPISLIITSFLFYYNNTLIFAALIGWAYLGLAETIDIYCYELLYLPLSTNLRLRSQSIANGLLTASGKIIAGILLLELTFMNSKVYTYSLVIATVGVLWMIALDLLKPYYRNAFANAISNYFSGSINYHISEFKKIRDSLKDKSLDAAIISLLKTSTDSHKITILNFVPEETLIRIKQYLLSLLDTGNLEVMLCVLNIIGRIGDHEDAKVLEKYMHEKDESIAQAATVNYQILEKGKSTPASEQQGEANEPLKTTALINSYHRGVTTAGLGYNEITQLLHRQPTFAIEVISKLKDPAFNKVINSLLLDDDLNVRKKALQYCLHASDTIFFTNILANYEKRELRELAREALYQLPNQALPLIYEKLQEGQTINFKALLLTTLGRIGNATDINYLSMQMSSETNPYIILIIARAIHEVTIRLKLSKQIIYGLLQQVENHLQDLEMLVSHVRPPENQTDNRMFFDAFYYHLEVILYLLSGIYKVKQFIYIAEIMNKDDPVFFSNSYELIESYLPRQLGKKLIEVLNKIKNPEGSADKTITELNFKSVWTKSILMSYLKNEENYVMSTTEKELIEKIKIITLLKQADLFKDVPGHYLLALLNIVSEEAYEEGQYLFKEGDQSDSLYIIMSGTISILHKNREIAKLASGNCIEELSLIDQFPHLTTARALEKSHILRISSLDFDDVMSTYPEISHTLVHHLAKMLRETQAEQNI